MNPQDPESAHRIVAEFAEIHERLLTSSRLPASVRTLEYPKQTIKDAILTCFHALRATDQLTPELQAWLEEGYAGLAEYVDEELVRVVVEYRQAAETVAAEGAAARERVRTPAWGRLAETGRLAGDVARAIAEDAVQLRAEFRGQLPPIATETT